MDADLEYERRLRDLDREWAKPPKRDAYAKPSVSLLNARSVAQQLVKVKTFSEVASVAKVMDAMIAHESAGACRRMNADYVKVDALLRERHEADAKARGLVHSAKMKVLARDRDRGSRPIERQCQLLREQHKARKREQERPMPDTIIPRPGGDSPCVDVMAATGDNHALRLPPITPIKRRTPSNKSKAPAQGSRLGPLGGAQAKERLFVNDPGSVVGECAMDAPATAARHRPAGSTANGRPPRR